MEIWPNDSVSLVSFICLSRIVTNLLALTLEEVFLIAFELMQAILRRIALPSECIRIVLYKLT